MRDVRAKAALTLFLCVCAFVVPLWYQLVLLLPVVLAPFLVSPFSFNSPRARQAYMKFLLYATVLFFLLVLLNGLLLRDASPQTTLLGIPFFESGLLFGLRVAVRLLLLSFSLLVFFLSTRIRTVTDELLSVGIPSHIVLPVLLALYFLDQLPIRIGRIFAAQEARGAPVREHALKRFRAFFSILTPLVLSSVAESVERGVALELRGFGSAAQFTPSQRATRRHPSRLALMFLLLTIAVLVWRIAEWLL